MSLNEVWRGGLPQWLMSLGPTFYAISIFLAIRDELVSKRWGMLKSADMSAKWMSWFLPLAVLSLINSLLGSITAKVLPDIHAFESVSFIVLFGSLFFLNIALTAASLFMAALCGTIQSTTLTVFIIMTMIVASSAPIIGVSVDRGYSFGDPSYVSPGSGGAFWRYMSTESVETGSARVCHNPIVSYEQSRVFKTEQERQVLTKEEWLEGCYVTAGGSTLHTNVFFVWYFIPQASVSFKIISNSLLQCLDLTLFLGPRLTS